MWAVSMESSFKGCSSVVHWPRRTEKETRVRHLLLAAATLATALGIGVGNLEAASFALDSLANSGVQTVDVRYYRRHPSYYYRRGGDPSYTSRHCYNRDEIRELQRMWPETNWPRSMRCFPYR